MTSFEQALQRYPIISVQRGTALYLQGDKPSYMYIIEQGIVKAYIITSDGAERQITLQGQGEDIPMGFSTGLVDKVEYFYEAYSRSCKLRRIPRKEFMKILRGDEKMLFEFYSRHEKQMRALLARINALEHSRASDKVAFMLMQMSDQIGIRLRPYQSRFRLTVTQQEIADMVGLTRETTGIELKKLEVKKILSHSRKNYVLYVERLKQYLENR